MSVKCKLHDKETVLTKGALDVLLNRCIKIRKNNQVREISQSDIEEILKVNEKFIDLKINCDSKNEMKIPDDLLDDIIKLGGNVTTEYDADTLFVFVRMQSGGDDI